MLFRCLLVFLFFCLQVKAQVAHDYLRQLIEELAETLPEDYDVSELEEQLQYLSEHPINLNQTSTEELSKLPFLTPLQISNFFIHVKENGRLVDILELQGIPAFDVLTIKKLLPFLTIRPPDLARPITYRNLLKFGENQLLFRLGRVVEKQKGFQELEGSRYLGTPERLLLRYQFVYGDRITAAVVSEKDAGESFSKTNALDFVSAHVSINQIGCFRKTVVGDYTLQFGQGLTLWSGFSFGKALDVVGGVKNGTGLKPYHSSNEFSFLRGLATTIAFHRLELTPFFSSRKLDATIDENEFSEATLSAVTATGLHRTANERKHQNSLLQQAYGMSAQYHSAHLNLGITGYRTTFDKLFVPGPQVYQIFGFTGTQLFNSGLNYDYAFRNIFFFGEMAKSFPGGLAYLNGLLASLSANISVTVLNRHYPINYYNFNNQAFSEGSETANENGLFMGLNVNLGKAISISFFADHYQFPWLKFRTDAPSGGDEVAGQVNYTPSKTFKVSLRYKSEIKQQNSALPTPVSYLQNVSKGSYRADVDWQLNRFLKCKNRLELTQFNKESEYPTFGYLIYQDIAYTPSPSRLSGNIRLAYFNIAQYDNRIYAYENDVLYNSSFGMYYGKGYRTVLNLKYRLAKQLDCWFRHTLFWYPKVDHVGSGLDEISGNLKNDVKIQLRYQF